MIDRILNYIADLLFGPAIQEEIAETHDQFRAREAAEGKEKAHGGR